MLKHAKLDGLPVRYVAGDDGLPTDAWLYCSGRGWIELNTAECAHEAGVMTAEQFIERFKHPPPLPLPRPSRGRGAR
jgi:hypothetical protein